MSLSAEAKRVLAGNRLRGISDWEGRAYDFVCPSRATYPFQWFWDSSFHAVALLHVDPELAKQEIRCLLQGTQADGFMPHMLLWEKQYHPAALREYDIVLGAPFFTATIQPPVLARAIWRIWQATGDTAFVAEVLPPTLRFFQWLADVREVDGDSLIVTIQPDESGLDASPKYDVALGLSGLPAADIAPAHRRAMQRQFTAYEPYRQHPARLAQLDAFRWKDVMVNCIYADGLRLLAQLGDVAGLAAPRAQELALRATGVSETLMTKCWDESRGVFWDIYGREERPARTLTFSGLFPIILSDLEPGVVSRLVNEHLLNADEFWLPYPVPSVAATEPAFEPDFASHAIWRGPTWVNVNWYLYWGLRQHGYRAVATELARRTLEMVEQGGVREFFNPYTAEGYGAVDFGWTTLVLDLLAAEGWSD